MASSYITNQELNNYVGNKIAQQIFAYIYDGSYLTSEITDRFKKSLIVLGKEGQIYNPLTNTYIGIGTSEKNKIHAYITAANNKIDALNTSLTASLVSAIYANWDAQDWKDVGINDEDVLGSLFATNNIVLKGEGNYDTASQLRTYTEKANVNNRANLAQADYEAIEAAAKNVVTNTTSIFADSGITVSLVKGENEYRYEYSYLYDVDGIPTTGLRILWEKRSDHEGSLPDKISGDDPLNPGSQVDYNLIKDSSNKPVYRNGKNVFSIDDKQTWSYIASAYAYTLNFAQDFTKSEVNRIYSQLLGNANNSIVPVSYESVKELVVNGSATVENPTLGTFVLNSDTVIFKKVAVSDHLVTGKRYEKNPTGGDEATPIEISYIYTTVIENNDGSDTIDLGVTGFNAVHSFAEAQALTTASLTADNKDLYYADYIDGDYYTHDYVLTPVDDLNEIGESDIYSLVIIDPLHSDTSNVNILDGIQTLKEVAYVLDQITNGGEAGIELAYSIAQNHIDIIELDRRLDAVEAGQTAVRSIKNTNDGDYIDLQLTSNVPVGTGEDDGRYFGNVELKVDLNVAYIYDDAQLTNSDSEKIITATRTEVALGGAASYTTEYVSSNYSYNVNKLHDGLVDKKWALTYGAELMYVSNAYSSYQAAVALAKADERIDALDASYTTPADQFISGYKQQNGLVTVESRVLPQDKVTVSSVVWGENSGIQYTAFANASEITEAVASEAKIYVVDGTGFEEFNEVDANVKDLPSGNAAFGGIYVKEGNTYVEINTLGDITAAKNSYALGKDYVNYVQLYKQFTKYTLIDNADIDLTAFATYFTRNTGYTKSTDYITAETHQNLVEHDGLGQTTLHIKTHITKIVDAEETNTGLVDAWDLRQTLANMFEWVDLSEYVDGTTNPLNQ